jgi:2-phospho-L-lactate guanylyltransferase
VSVRAVIAVRGGADAKSRCAPELDADARAELVCAMLLDMIAALTGSRRIDEVEVVTPTLELVQAARKAGAAGWLEPQARGINAAFEAARARLGAADPQGVMIALPGDLPLLEAAELEPALRLLARGKVVLAPAAADGGTGAVVVHANAPFDFHFGQDSFRRHWDGAVRAGLEPIRLEAPSLGLDIDRPQDLAALQRRSPGGRSASFLARRLRPTEALS